MYQSVVNFGVPYEVITYLVHVCGAGHDFLPRRCWHTSHHNCVPAFGD